MKSKLAVILFVLAVALFIFLTGNRSNFADRGVSGIPEPVQGPAQGTVTTTAAGYDTVITFKASYDIKALVVSTKNYRGTGVFDSLSPKDVALAWGSVAQHNNDINFHWSQSGRWYYWYTDGSVDLTPVGSSSGVSRQSSNNHLIPADDSVREMIGKIKTGDYIEIIGYLVNLKATSSGSGKYYTNSSSLSRNDTGDGACEIIYVTDVKWL